MNKEGEKPSLSIEELKKLSDESQMKLSDVGMNLVLCGISFALSMFSMVYPIIDKWYPEDLITSVKVSAFFQCCAIISLIVAGSKLQRKM